MIYIKNKTCFIVSPSLLSSLLVFRLFYTLLSAILIDVMYYDVLYLLWYCMTIQSDSLILTLFFVIVLCNHIV